MLGRELQTTWLRLLDDDQADERTLADLYEWLKSNTLDKDRCEDMIQDMEKLQWSLNTIPRAAWPSKRYWQEGWANLTICTPAPLWWIWLRRG
jgi:hypothetical protein